LDALHFPPKGSGGATLKRPVVGYWYLSARNGDMILQRFKFQPVQRAQAQVRRHVIMMHRCAATAST